MLIKSNFFIFNLIILFKETSHLTWMTINIKFKPIFKDTNILSIYF